MTRLSEYDFVVINSSAGKDSQAMTDYLAALARSEGYPKERLILAHADLGRMEWPGTRELAEYHAKTYGLRFWVKSRPQGNLLSHVLQREKWPDSGNRFCTADHKRGQIGTLLTTLGDGIKILNCMGMRAQESPARAKLQPFEINKRFTNSRRHVDNWLPLHSWTAGDVWARVHSSPAPYHYAYDLGMPRLSCVFCIFSPPAALMVAGYHNRNLLAEYSAVERKIGHTFRHKFQIKSIQDRLLQGETPPEKIEDWRM
jgi:3'-phosphoadenosine 5'-phosphosulfate sulfotransferase (PAPS reductase)/FAD synthetase